MQLSTQVEDVSQPILNIPNFPVNFQAKVDLIPLQSLVENKAYTPIPCCLLEYVITTDNFSDFEKLYYLLVYSLELIRINLKQDKPIALSADDWAKMLNCSRSQIFIMQQDMIKKGYFLVESGKNQGTNNHNIRNLITPTIPDDIFKQLCKEDNKVGEHLPYDESIESKISYFNKVKLFIPLNHNLLKIITATKLLNPSQKLSWIDFFSRGYKCHKYFDSMNLKDGEFGTNIINGINHSFYFITSYKDLANKLACDEKYLSKILIALEKAGFIFRQRISCMKDKILRRRKDKSLWVITLLLPHDCIIELKKAKDRYIKQADNELENESNTPNSEVDKEQNKDSINDHTPDKLVEQNIIDDNYNNHDNFDDLDNSNYDYKEEEYTEEHVNNTTCKTQTNNLDFPSNPNLINHNISNNSSSNLSTNIVDKFEDINGDENLIASYDHDIANSALLYNKYPLLNIEDIKSNLTRTQKVIFNRFLYNFNYLEENKIERKQDIQIKKEFSICSTFIRDIIKKLPKDKIEKAKKFAYSIILKNLAKGYAATLDKHELARQFICHIDNWKAKKYTSLSQEQQIDLALAVAWKATTNGTWQIPYIWAKAAVLDCEYKAYQQKYQDTGVLSHDIKTLEKDVCKLLGYFCFDLEKRIIESCPHIPSKDQLPAVIEHESNNNIDFNNDYIEQSTSTELAIKKPKESVFLKNVEMYENLERQGYFKLEFAKDGITFKTQQVGNHKYFATLKDIKIDNEDIYYTVKLKKGTVIDSKDHYSIDFDNHSSSQLETMKINNDKTQLLLENLA